jgi:hypothetical protein
VSAATSRCSRTRDAAAGHSSLKRSKGLSGLSCRSCSFNRPSTQCGR